MNSENACTPILIVGYGRFNNIEKQIKLLLGLSERRIYLHIDKGKTKKIQDEQSEFIGAIESQFRNRISVLHRERNLGVGIGVVSAIDWFFTKEETGIIIEDDLLFNHSSIKFLEMGIEFVSGIERALMVAGSTFLQHDYSGLEKKCTWTNIPLIWGWGTTQSKWLQLRNLITDSQLPNWQDFFSPARSFFQSGRIKALSQKVDTWDTPLAYMMFKRKFLCLVSPENYFSNVGNDEFAVHTRYDSFPLFMPISTVAPDLSWFYPPNSEETQLANKRYLNNLYKVRPRNIIGLLATLYLIPKISKLRNLLS